MTESPSESTDTPARSFAARVADAVGAESWSAEFDTVRVYVDRSSWVDAVTKARDDLGLRFFSWLSAVDWSTDVAVGEPVADVDGLDERYEVICRLSSVESWEGAQIIAALPKDDPVIDSIVTVFPGAEWHEREAAEMFGIDFEGNPHLVNLYLPDRFEGHPLLKSYPLLAREVKPWPGTVDVEPMPESADGDATEADDDATEADEGTGDE